MTKRGRNREKKPTAEQQETMPAAGAAAAGTDAVGQSGADERKPPERGGQAAAAPNGAAGETSAQPGADGAAQGDVGGADVGEEGPKDPDGNPAGTEAPSDIDPTIEPADYVIRAAEQACRSVFHDLLEYHGCEYEQYERMTLLTGSDHSRGTNAMAAQIRSIGRERATPAVIGQQLKILHLVEDPELSDFEILLARIFTEIVTGIDAFDAAQEQKRLDRIAEKQKPAPVPIEDTTMEMVDDVMETV